MSESRHPYERVTSHDMHEWVTSRIQQRHVTYTDESRHTHKWVTSHISMNHVTHINEPRHMYEWVLRHSVVFYFLISQYLCVYGTQKTRSREIVCMCIFFGVRVCVCGCMCARVCVYVCVPLRLQHTKGSMSWKNGYICVWERERERESVCVCVRAWVGGGVRVCGGGGGPPWFFGLGKGWFAGKNPLPPK